MFDLSHQSMSALFAQLPRAATGATVTAGDGAYHGLERRSSASHAARLLALMFDEIDYGVLLVTADTSTLLHANHAARAELDANYPLQLFGRELQARHAADAAPLHDALSGARRGLRKLVTLGAEGHRVGVSVVPLGSPGDAGPQATLLLLGKRQVCERLSVQWFARAHALTPAETRVLEGLCEGDDPRDVARKHQVGLATVRTQIGCIRAKTGTDSIRELVRRVAVLPPMRSALRTT
jgi:DNA-binding CsgD family transcriptional regulator